MPLLAKLRKLIDDVGDGQQTPNQGEVEDEQEQEQEDERDEVEDVEGVEAEDDEGEGVYGNVQEDGGYQEQGNEEAGKSEADPNRSIASTNSIATTDCAQVISVNFSKHNAQYAK